MSKVREYYDANTWKFVLTSAEGALHRELWGPGTADRRDALHYIHRRVLDEVTALEPSGRARVVDLGCGVGAGALYLAEHIPAEVHGISLSPAQIAHATRRARRRTSLAGSAAFHEGDFCALSAELRGALAGADLAYAIESFVHAPSAAGFFAEVAALLRPGGRLVLVDDMVTDGAESIASAGAGAGAGSNGQGGPGAPDAPPGAAALFDDVRAGWHIQSLLSARQIAAIAAGAGFELVRRTSLSPYMRLGRPRDRLIRALQPLLRRGRRWSYWCQSLVGGDALQRCHQLGLLEYDELVLVRGAAHEQGA
ncbi:MAG TPA: class I SAM-dependent methyltransferase [Kofleriaceae bacterium]|nr:class I SAM-dependent methyltransferase [Kofleriaceae bacterium]